MDYKDICSVLEGAEILEEKELSLGTVDTGSFALNRIVSGDHKLGYAIGSIVELSGEAGSGKTAFISQAFKDAQKQGYHCVMIDNEHAYSKEFAKQLGVDNSKVIYAQPESMEECFEFAEKVILAIRDKDPKTPIVVGFDSIGTAPCKKELSDDYESNQEMIGAIRAKSAGKCLRKFNALLRRERALLLIVNQLRSKVGVVYGDPTTTAGGGKALPFYASVRLRLHVPPSGIIRDSLKNPVGVSGEIKCLKNRSTAPFQSCAFKFHFKEGMDEAFGLVEDHVKLGKVEQKGGWMTYGNKNYRSAELREILAETLKNE